MGRFINADDTDYLGADGDPVSFNLFTYCSNNPVMGSDPTGHWDWGKFFSGASLLVTGLTAVATAATILTCGAAAPLMVAVAAATATAGTLTVANGAAEMIESGTGFNFVRDGVMGGNTKAYEAYRDTMSTISEIGTMICGSYYAAKGGNVCFVAGTLVKTADGDRPIEEIAAGDYVWAWDEATGDIALKEVIETYVNETSELIHLFVNGEEIITTPTHPFYSPVKGWTDAVNLRAGDILVLVNGEYVIVEKVQHEILESPVTVYNFNVSDYHTYYVASTGVLVHNSCTRRSAMREAKRSVNIPMSESPTTISRIKMVGENGRTYFAKLEIYGQKFIRDDLGGHLFKDGATISRHFNAGIIDEVGKFIQNELHFWY